MFRLLYLILFTGLLMLLSFGSLAEQSSWDISHSKLGPQDEKNITVYHSPSCGCCKAWITHLKKHNFTVTDRPIEDVDPIKARYGVPPEAASCHTAVIDGYVIEGHVPADDIKRLIKTKPKIAGISVPQMPQGSPGMEMGNVKETFNVIAFDGKGNFDVFSRYQDY